MKMRELVLENRAHPIVRDHAEAAVSGVHAGDRMAEARAIHDWITARADYRRDPNGAEWLQAPWAVLACQMDVGIRAQLDCDDFTDLSLAMLESIGHETALQIVSELPTREFNHVYGLDYIGNVAVRLDLTNAYRPAGAGGRPPETRAMTVDINGGLIAASPWWVR
jgi:hypothetical protein